VRWNLSVICCVFLLQPGRLSTSSCIYWPLVPLPLKITYSTHVPISPLGCWFFRGWVFWALCRLAISSLWNE
jgi:hypothetical protein